MVNKSDKGGRVTKGDVPNLSPYLTLAIIPLDISVALSVCFTGS